MDLTTFSKEIHEGNKRKGFYDGEEKQLGTMLMLVVSELGEALEADRHSLKADLNYYDGLMNASYDFQTSFKQSIKDTVEDEIADSIIRLLDICGYYNIDIQTHVELKLKYNKTRGQRHGKKY
jgi:NTP pyrophosphatase (non-canonical NTP hydrolase)